MLSGSSFRGSESAWTSIKTGSALVLRSFGFGWTVVVVRSLSRPFTRILSEPTKVAIYSSRTVALLRASIHAVPVGVALAEIALNCREIYVGDNVNNISYIQYAAKVHELVIQGSLAAILFAYIRFEMALGHGLPFGALFFGLQLNQISTLWSTEIWASASASHFPLRRRLTLLILTLTCIVLAAVVGPSSAILLIPRLDHWPAGRTNVWVNATKDEVWPTRLSGDMVSPSCSSLANITASDSCPASESISIQNFMTLVDVEDFELDLAGVPVTGQTSLRTLRFDGRDPPSLDYAYSIVYSTVPQSVITDALREIGIQYENSMQQMITSEADLPSATGMHTHTISEDYYQPYTAASCARDVIQGPSDATPVFFPFAPGSLKYQMDLSGRVNNTAFLYEDSPIAGVLYDGVNRSELYRAPGNFSEYRLLWFELPEIHFKGSTIGAVGLLPRAPNNSSQEILVCNLSAGSGPSVLNVTTSVSSPDGELLSDMVVSNSVRNDAVYEDFYNRHDPQRIICQFPVFPQHPITVDTAWADYLNPTVQDLNTTVFNSLMEVQMGPRVEPWEVGHIVPTVILSGLLTNALARTAFLAWLQGDVKTTPYQLGATNYDLADGKRWYSGKGDMFTIPANASASWIKFEVETTVHGYAYSTRGTAPKVAIVFLLLYCLLAALHILYAAITGISSTSWDTIAEVTALAVNSTPTRVLRNTCAGIVDHNIFRLPVRVLVAGDGEGDGEHLEMVFGNVDEVEATKRRIHPGRVYGTLPKKVQ